MPAEPTYSPAIEACLAALVDLYDGIAMYGQDGSPARTRAELTVLRQVAVAAAREADPFVVTQRNTSVPRPSYDKRSKSVKRVDQVHPAWLTERRVLSAYLQDELLDGLLNEAQTRLGRRRLPRLQRAMPFVNDHPISSAVRRVPVSKRDGRWRSTGRRVRTRRDALRWLAAVICVVADTWENVRDDKFDLSFSIGVGLMASRK